jgi:hypothetical protein
MLDIFYRVEPCLREAQPLAHCKLEVATGADSGSGQGFTFGETVGDFVADDGAELGIGALLLVAVADATEVEVRAVAYVALILI